MSEFERQIANVTFTDYNHKLGASFYFMPSFYTIETGDH